jgi:hypothetical protein
MLAIFRRIFDSSTIPVTDLVRERVDDLFRVEDRQEAIAILEQHFGFSLPLIPGTKPETYNPVRCAALRVSDGNLECLKKLITQAHHDWRDLLQDAGFAWDTEAHKNWRPKAKTPNKP